MGFSRLYFDTSGRIGRGHFWIGVAGIAAVVVIVTLITAQVLDPLSFGAELAVFVLEVVLAVPTSALFAKRFQDRGRTGLYAAIPVAVFVVVALLTLFGLTGSEAAPTALGSALGFVDLVVGLWVLIDLGVVRGTVGANAFGPDPLAAA